MADAKRIKDESLAIIDSAITILDRYPEFNETNTNLSYDTSTNPFSFLMDALKRVKGFDVFLKIVASFLSFGIPALELTTKELLLERLKLIQSCTLNPFITKQLLLNGIVVDLYMLDLTQMLNFCPLSDDERFSENNIGKCFYFGCDQFQKTDELVRAGDFNAFLWYTINKAFSREVWYGVNIIESNVDSLWYGTNNGLDLKTKVVQKEPSDLPHDESTKCKKSNGIITLRYCERPSALRNAEGNGYTGDEDISTNSPALQVPHNNCLQVFLGNVQEIPDAEVENLKTTISNANSIIENSKNRIGLLTSDITNINFRIEDAKTEYRKQIIEKGEYESIVKGYENLISSKKDEIINEERQIKTQTDIRTQSERNLIQIVNAGGQHYRSIEQNYYYGHTIFEFYTDYIMSLKLFDSKVILAQLLDALTDCMSINLHMSYEQLLVKYETERMVKEIINSDYDVVSDCFFVFNNREYDEMLKKAELIREGRYGKSNDNTTGVKIDAEDILNGLNEINDTASQAGVEKITHILERVSETVTGNDYKSTSKGKFNVNAQTNFYEVIMNNLAYIITMTILSPKVYLVLAIQLKLLQREPDFKLNDFIDKNRQMFSEIIRSVRDEMLKFFVRELMDILDDMARAVAIKITAEQTEYYKQLIRRITGCLNNSRNGNGLPWDMDVVTHADIYGEESQPKEEC